MDRRALESELEAAFEGDERERRVVSRQARDLADSGQFERDLGAELTPSVVVSNMADAPDVTGVVQRWNWWMGSLEVAHGGYDRFRVQPWSLD